MTDEELQRRIVVAYPKISPILLLLIGMAINLLIKRYCKSATGESIVKLAGIRSRFQMMRLEKAIKDVIREQNKNLVEKIKISKKEIDLVVKAVFKVAEEAKPEEATLFLKRRLSC